MTLFNIITINSEWGEKKHLEFIISLNIYISALPREEQQRTSMASFHLEIDDRTEEERKKDREMRKQYQASKKSNLPMDTELHEDLGYVCPKIRINPNFAE